MTDRWISRQIEETYEGLAHMVMEAEKSQDLQAGDLGKQVSFSPSPKAELKSAEPLWGGRRTWLSQLTQKKQISPCSHFWLYSVLQWIG